MPARVAQEGVLVNALAADSASWTLPPVARSAVEARRHVRDVLNEWGLQDLCDAALLLTSELVTNAVVHARSQIRLLVELYDGAEVRIAVSDSSPVPPSLRPRSDSATTGRGLLLLSRLADRWDADVSSTGKTVWFTLSGRRDPWAGFNSGDWLGEAH